MTRILHIDTSPGGPDAAYSRQASAELVAALSARWPGAELTYRDLAKTPPPHVNGALRVSWMTPPGRRTSEQAEIIARCEGFIGDLKAADMVVIGAPMHNFTVPSTLKAWIDHVLIAGQIFRYTPEGMPEGLVKGKKTPSRARERRGLQRRASRLRRLPRARPPGRPRLHRHGLRAWDLAPRRRPQP